MGANQLPLGLDLVGTDVALVGGDADFLIDTGELAQLLDVAVHRLVGIVRQGLAVLERGVLVVQKMRWNARYSLEKRLAAGDFVMR